MTDSVERPRRVLRLYVAGHNAAAQRARENRLRLLAASHAIAEIEVVDVLEQPGLAEAAGILATPTLSDETRHPPRRIVGDLSDHARVLSFLAIRSEEEKR
ncbi:circadian clock protein KaiB [Alsobacter soli]|uniref:Circadian clock protein KaiB n=1 Tax=Alsobacter soli TaxID=2109933 RepID=A0A2T1HWG4_9HYPH|nr:circadian clock KaiB family protein [Alsobacter soli]PSC06037.1 circadian clock protein KaiB [Alsobacter soli]